VNAGSIKLKDYNVFKAYLSKYMKRFNLNKVGKIEAENFYAWLERHGEM